MWRTGLSEGEQIKVLPDICKHAIFHLAHQYYWQFKLCPHSRFIGGCRPIIRNL